MLTVDKFVNVDTLFMIVCAICVKILQNAEIIIKKSQIGPIKTRKTVFDKSFYFSPHSIIVHNTHAI